MAGRQLFLTIFFTFMSLCACSPTKTTTSPQIPATSTGVEPTGTTASPTNTLELTVDSPTLTEAPTETASPTTTQPPTATLSPTQTPELSGSGGGVLLFVSTRDGNGEIYIMNADGSGQRRLTNYRDWDGYPSWSPNGEQIVFYRHLSDTKWVILVMDPDGGNPQQLTNNDSCDGAPSWSPDGVWIAFTASPACDEDSREISLIPVPGTDGYVAGEGERQLTDTDGGNWFSSWSPDGKRIAFTSNRDGNHEIYVMDADGSRQQNLTGNQYNDNEPAWSPDGEEILFVSDRDGDNEIYIMDADGTNIRQLTENVRKDQSPTWSPDGTQIAYYTHLSQWKWAILVMDADGGNQRQITDGSGIDMLPVWRPEPGVGADSTTLNPDGTGTVVDQDGNEYPIIQIGDQWLMAASLNVSHAPDGEPVEGYCYDNDEGNCEIYGRLYDWNTAMDGSIEPGARGICPIGWHIPGESDWEELFATLGGRQVAGGKMKATGTTHWQAPNQGATNLSGFSALPAGAYIPFIDGFEGLRVGVHFWSSTSNAYRAEIPTLHKDETGVTILVESKSVTASVRCVMD